jgi:hypothetical protein
MNRATVTDVRNANKPSTNARSKNALFPVSAVAMRSPQEIRAVRPSSATARSPIVPRRIARDEMIIDAKSKMMSATVKAVFISSSPQ